MTSPDGPSHGWYRVNSQGIDMNRAYFVRGSDPKRQAHEAYIVQKDLEELMASEAPLTTLWSMHTWLGPVEPILLPGPEFNTQSFSWERLRDILIKNDPDKLAEPLKLDSKPAISNSTKWHGGPHVQFGISTFLCEGSGDWSRKEDSLNAGVLLIRSLVEFYQGVKQPIQ
jgi:hypothetical protein